MRRLFLGVAVFLASSVPLSSAGGDLSLSWVSLDRSAFDPQKGEKLSLRFRISGPARVTVQFIDAFDDVVRTLTQEEKDPGDKQFVWDGRDDEGSLVPAEAYFYTLSATPLSADSATPVVYDLRERSGGEPVYPAETKLDPASGRVSYVLPQSSRVRVILSRQEQLWPIVTLLDWAPRTAGRHEEAWDGWDKSHLVNAREMPGLLPIFYAFSLPENVVFVEGVAGPRRNPDSAKLIGYRLPSSSERELHFHALHPRARCYDPLITVSFPESAKRASSGPLRISEPTPLRFDIAPEQLPGHLAPLPRLSVFIFVDGFLVERELVGYVTYQWMVNPARLGPGEHVISGLLAWRDDHFGIVHTKVWVER